MKSRSRQSSRQKYRTFVDDYRHGRLDDTREGQKPVPVSRAGADQAPEPPVEEAPAAKKAKRREYLREYARWLWPHRFKVAVVFLLAALTAGLQMVEPLFLRYIIDDVLLVEGLDAEARVQRLNMAGAAFLGLILLSNAVSVTRDYRQKLMNAGLMLALRRALFDRMLHLPLPKLWDMKTGGILSRLTGDVDTTTGLMQMAFISPAISVMKLIIAIVILVRLNWQLTLMAVAVIPGAMAISFISARRVRPIYRSIRKDAELIDGRVGETFSGLRVVRAFGRELRELAGYMVGRHAVMRKELFAHRRELALWTSWGVLVSGVSVIIMWYGGHLNIRGEATVGDLLAFQYMAMLLLNPVWNLVNSFSEMQRSLAAMERVFEILGLPADKPDRPDARPAPAVVDDIAFEDVEFEYREGRPVVRDFNVRVPGGTVVALVGRSGAGKTTVTDLVARFHDPTRGRILVNGIDVRDFQLQSYRSLLAIVQQDVFLFDGSVRDNIAYGRHDATDAEIEDAARRANAHEFIEKLPEQYDTFVGERGVKLSGGQQQRLAIARAILKSPQILILDEATSNLDTESEQLIQAAMAGLFAGRTTFVIAHRLSTVHRANLILLMEDGRIVERGTHADLMARRGLYYDMVQRQAQAHDTNFLELRT